MMETPIGMQVLYTDKSCTWVGHCSSHDEVPTRRKYKLLLLCVYRRTMYLYIRIKLLLFIAYILLL